MSTFKLHQTLRITYADFFRKDLHRRPVDLGVAVVDTVQQKGPTLTHVVDRVVGNGGRPGSLNLLEDV